MVDPDEASGGRYASSELRHATTDDTDSVYALICELLKRFRLSGFRDGFAANLPDQRSLPFSATAAVHQTAALISIMPTDGRSVSCALPPMRGQNWQSASAWQKK
ncbi:hypothetical protein KCP74_02990 [Salmonella enterica subsp. enterica]|nr:hypothetical protein KCP74_02990 [Salmonella enterica subsp. enterica]